MESRIVRPFHSSKLNKWRFQRKYVKLSFVKKEDNDYESSSKHWGQFLIEDKTQKYSVKTTNVKIKNEIVVNAKIIQLNRCHPGLKKQGKVENGEPLAEDEE